MDTVEQLNGTYFYAGRSNLTSSELPTWLGGYTPWTARKIYVRNIGTFVGRTVPLLGVIILAVDISQIIYCTVRDYNFIVSEADKIW